MGEGCVKEATREGEGGLKTAGGDDARKQEREVQR